MSQSPDNELRWLVDRRPDVSQVGDQGGRHTCLAWAATAAHEANTLEALCVEYLHWAGKTTTAKRGSVAGLVKALSSDGQPPSEQWAYDPDIDEDSPSYHPPSTVVGPFSNATVRLVDPDVDSLMVELTDELLPVAALRVSEIFLQAPGGIVSGGGSGTDGHMVTVVGIAQASVDTSALTAGTRLVCVRNSWGPTWGIDGHALVSEEDWLAMVDGALVLEP